MNINKDDLDLRNCDCMELMAEYPDNWFDLAIVDPPYGINVNVSMGRRKGDKKSDYHKFAGGDTCSPDAPYFAELQRVSKNQIIWGQITSLARCHLIVHVGLRGIKGLAMR